MCPKKYVVGDRQAKQRSESDDVLIVCFSCLCAVTLNDVIIHNRAVEVSSTAVRGGFDRLLMTPLMACENPSWYKNLAVLAQAANRMRDNFAAVPTRTSDAPVWVQAHKMQSLRWIDCIVKPRRV